MKENNNIKSLEEKYFSEFVDNYITSIKEWEWKDSGDFKIFLNELEDYLSKNKRLDSEDFLYEKENNPFSSKDDYFKYLESLCNLIFNYCDKYFIPPINDDIEDNLCFNEYCVLFKYKDTFYKVERISGQGTIDIISVYDGDNKNCFIDYENLLCSDSPENYNKIVLTSLENALSLFKYNFKEQLDFLGYDVELVKK